MKNFNRVFSFLLVLTLLVGTASLALADGIRPIPVDMLEHGSVPKQEGWTVPGKEYQDESIHATLYERGGYKSKSSDGNTTIRWAVVEIKDPSQLRTVLSYDSFEVKQAATAPEMVEYIHPVIAFNDDYVKMNNYRGYVIRQGVFCSDNLDDWGPDMKQDVLIIDDLGDLSVVQRASSADVQACLSEMESAGRTAVNAFTFGPALILDGELQEIDRNMSEHSLNLAVARTVFCQLDTLTYAVFTADAPATGIGMNCEELARFILKQFPGCKVAYNLDGGGSSRLYVGNKRVNQANGRREIYGMIYFASAVSED